MEQPSRRELLGGTAALLGLTAGCQLLSEGEQRTDPGKLPDEAGDRLRASQMVVGTEPAGRPLISNESRTIYVDPDAGDDDDDGTENAPLQTIQAAVQRVPIYLRHQYTIDLATVPDTPVSYDEDVLVPAVIGTGQAAQEEGAPSPGPVQNLVIKGKDGAPEAVEIGSIMFGNVIGTSASHLLFVTVTRDSPYDNEDYGLSAYGTGEVQLFGIGFTDGPTNGILAYGSKMKASVVNLGQDSLQVGLRAKRHASIMTRDIEGQTSGPAFSSVSNSRLTIKGGNRASGNPQYKTRVGGLIYDLGSDSWRGLPDEGSNRTRYQGGESKDRDCGDIWYEDGRGDRKEGFYGQRSDGSVHLG